jgi:catechol 2,3-dioxygenase-like lactoylglutathione lyase family enzyme
MMLNHIGIGVSDYDGSKTFYDAVPGAHPDGHTTKAVRHTPA